MVPAILLRVIGEACGRFQVLAEAFVLNIEVIALALALWLFCKTCNLFYMFYHMYDISHDLYKKKTKD